MINQSYKNFEIILVDDGSIDDSSKICDNYARDYDQIISIHQCNGGQLSAREHGIKIATGDFCVFLDADDYLELNALEILAKYLHEFDCDCLIYNYRKIKNGEVLNYEFKADDSCIVYESKRDIFQKILSTSIYNSLCLKCINRNAFKEIDYSKFYHIRHGEDLLHSIYALNNCSKVCFIPDILYNYIFNTESVTNSVDYNKYEVDFTIRETVLSFLISGNFFNEEDYKSYRTSAIISLLTTITSISNSNVSKKRKTKLFKDIWNSNYYQSFIHKQPYCKIKNKKKNLIFKLFEWKFYSVIFLATKMYNKKQNKNRGFYVL